MRTVNVQTNHTAYDVMIGRNILLDAGGLMRARIPACRAMLVTDDIVDALYADSVLAAVQNGGYEVCKYVFPHGECSKNMESYRALLEAMAQNGLTRGDILIALGGGVVGDLAGYAAATYLRGIRFVMIPTTLLAAVDSSVGGKTGVNLNAGKNLTGAFWQPELVLCDVAMFATLSDAILADGYAETIKYGMIRDATLLTGLQPGTFMAQAEAMVERCVTIKSEAVALDERDTGARQLLNFGHTVAHAIEKLSGYTITHGHAVAAGMAVITRAAEQHGLCAGCLVPLIDVLERFQLPTATSYTAAQIAGVAAQDKKRLGGTLTLVLPKSLGVCVLYPIAADDFEAFLRPGLLAPKEC
ncbi:MAG: 3-dehydroquinate synthase [Christensenellaceae bacterium]|jgi:3-dehydroquinate synthase|nr:3-dehydroquinate synthase [Christensenellaceae bacterium]